MKNAKVEKKDIDYAKILGNIGFAKGLKAPAQDSEFMQLLKKYRSEYTAINSLLKAWTKGWHEANVASSKSNNLEAKKLAVIKSNAAPEVKLKALEKLNAVDNSFLADYQKMVQAYQAGDNKTALEMAKKLAESGSKDAARMKDVQHVLKRLGEIGANDNASSEVKLKALEKLNDSKDNDENKCNGKKRYYKGDLAEYTGESKEMHGGKFFALKMLEGIHKGKIFWTQHGPNGEKPK
jgi:hypothetical protein